MPRSIWDLVFRLVLLYCHKFLFSYVNPVLLGGVKIRQFFLRREEFLIYLPLNVIMLLLPYLDLYLLNRFEQPKAKGTCSFRCVCNKKRLK